MVWVSLHLPAMLYTFLKIWSEKNVQICVMSLNWNLHCVRGKDTSLNETTQCCFSLVASCSMLTAQCSAPKLTITTWIWQQSSIVGFISTLCSKSLWNLSWSGSLLQGTMKQWSFMNNLHQTKEWMRGQSCILYQ